MEGLRHATSGLCIQFKCWNTVGGNPLLQLLVQHTQTLSGRGGGHGRRAKRMQINRLFHPHQISVIKLCVRPWSRIILDCTCWPPCVSTETARRDAVQLSAQPWSGKRLKLFKTLHPSPSKFPIIVNSLHGQVGRLFSVHNYSHLWSVILVLAYLACIL
jgi:hypothetical protein